tara:strand:+ start:6452 stop:7084 length:633 start_codon:yes stop_codon:yes gene_type:complete
MYYPQSQIIVNLYTNGQEFIIKSSKENYIGNYWKTSDGKYFTGKTPESKNIQELIINASTINSNQLSSISSETLPTPTGVYLNDSYTINAEYSKLNSKLAKVNKIPTSFNPQLTQSDYDLGEFTRYFCKKTNELYYVEINKDTYTKLIGKDPNYLWQLYIPFKYQWIISGEEKQTYTINKNVTNYMIVKFKFNALNQFLKEDYLKFWKPK